MVRKNKSPSWGHNEPHVDGYPGDGHYYARCDICSRKMRVKDMLQTWGTRGTLLVCPNDYEDPHPQDYIQSFPERTAPELTRSEGPDRFDYIHTPSEIESGDTSNPTGRTPDAPTKLMTVPETSTEIRLSWEFLGSPGSSSIEGFKIERESPAGNGFSTLVANTRSPALYYEDTSVVAATQYNYRVSAINREGTGNTSPESATTTPS